MALEKVVLVILITYIWVSRTLVQKEDIRLPIRCYFPFSMMLLFGGHESQIFQVSPNQQPTTKAATGVTLCPGTRCPTEIEYVLPSEDRDNWG